MEKYFFEKLSSINNNSKSLTQVHLIRSHLSKVLPLPFQSQP